MADIVLTIPDGNKAEAAQRAYEKIRAIMIEVLDFKIAEQEDQAVIDQLNQMRADVQGQALKPFLFQMMKNGAEITGRKLIKEREALKARKQIRENEQSGTQDILGDIGQL